MKVTFDQSLKRVVNKGFEGLEGGGRRPRYLRLLPKAHSRAPLFDKN